MSSICSQKKIPSENCRFYLLFSSYFPHYSQSQPHPTSSHSLEVHSKYLDCNTKALQHLLSKSTILTSHIHHIQNLLFHITFASPIVQNLLTHLASLHKLHCQNSLCCQVLHKSNRIRFFNLPKFFNLLFWLGYTLLFFGMHSWCLKSWIPHTLTTRGTRMPSLCAKLLAVLSALFASCKKSAKRPHHIPSKTKMVNLLLKISTAYKQMESQNKTTHINDTAIIWLLVQSYQTRVAHE